jgi:RimJ/RimL family protein N-acetyltransferase
MKVTSGAAQLIAVLALQRAARPCFAAVGTIREGGMGHLPLSPRVFAAWKPVLITKGLAFAFAVWRDAQYVASCGINRINTANRFANLGYWVRATAMGQGVAPAAVRLVAEYAFREADIIRLEIVCAVGNVRSQRVAQKSGAVREGILRDRLPLPGGPSDAVMFSLVRST